MTVMAAEETLQSYLDAFNKGDVDAIGLPHVCVDGDAVETHHHCSNTTVDVIDDFPECFCEQVGPRLPAYCETRR